MSLFVNKTLMITGGTGSFGNAVLNRFLKTDIGEISFNIWGIRVSGCIQKNQQARRYLLNCELPLICTTKCINIP